MSEKTLMVDPPGGWKYGFPKTCSREVWDVSGKFREYLLKNGYPEEDLDLAESYCRVWEEEDEKV